MPGDDTELLLLYKRDAVLNSKLNLGNVLVGKSPLALISLAACC